MGTNEEIQNFDVEAYFENASNESHEQAGQEPSIGPVGSISDRYDAEHLNYLSENITDSFHSYILKSINEARLSNDGKRRLRLLAGEFTDKEIVVALIKDKGDWKSQLNNFREVAKNTKLGLRQIDATTEFFTLLSTIETHYTVKLSRAWKGFERIEQQTQRVKSETSSSYADRTERAEPTGLKKLAMNLHGGR